MDSPAPQRTPHRQIVPVRRRRVPKPHRFVNAPFDGESSEARQKQKPIDVTSDTSALSALCKLLRRRSFVERVASIAECDFVRFTGIVFARCSISDDCADGIPEDMRGFQDDVSFVIVDVPPGLVARALSGQASRRSAAATAAFAANLSGVQVPVCAVFERHGLDKDELSAEQEAAEQSNAEFQVQLSAWFDIASSRRVETDVFNLSGASLFEESSHLLDL
jgi:hypothetical protein